MRHSQACLPAATAFPDELDAAVREIRVELKAPVGVGVPHDEDLQAAAVR
jgi:hypothetical protein